MKNCNTQLKQLNFLSILTLRYLKKKTQAEIFKIYFEIIFAFKVFLHEFY